MHSRKQYLEQVRREYEEATGKKEKSRLLDEAQKRTGLNRKVLIRKLGLPALPSRRKGKRKRPATYDSAVLLALVKVWEIFDYPCGQRLAPALRQELVHLRSLGEVRCSETVAEKLQQISWRTIDRLLSREKQVRRLRRNRNPRMHPLLYQKIPVKVAADWDTNEVGNVQVDYVPHCGRSTGGDYVHTISAVDIATNWWEGQAIAGRSQEATREGLDRIRQRFPFRVKEIHPDNDTGMINELLWNYCRKARIRMSRSRPYKKNDNAWVEQKNWTHVRKTVGYHRYETMSELALINEIYELLRLYKNFFQPVIKLKRKTRVRGRIHRIYEEPRTPYARLLTSGQISKQTKQELEQTYRSLNPAELHRKVQLLQARLFELTQNRLAKKLPPARRGPSIDLRPRRRAAAV